MDNKKYAKRLKPENNVSLDKAIFKVGNKNCPVCVNSKDAYEEVASKYKDISFYNVDSDLFDRKRSEMKEIRKIVSNTRALPSFYFFHNGAMVRKVEGFNPRKFERYVKEF